jgi:hypothetical protein
MMRITFLIFGIGFGIVLWVVAMAAGYTTLGGDHSYESYMYVFFGLGLLVLIASIYLYLRPSPKAQRPDSNQFQ